MPAAPVRALQSVRSRGLGPTVQILRREVQRRTRHKRNVLAERRFDRQFGVQTLGNVKQPGLGESGSQWEDARMYSPTPVTFLRSQLRSLPLDPAGFTFVDIGSGKGRAPLVAADMGFRRSVGVELSEDLHAIAQANAAAYERHGGGGDLSFVQADATTFAFPSGPVVLFMYDPFGEPAVRAVSENLASTYRAEPAEVFVVYYAPNYRHVFDVMPFLAPLAEGDHWCSTH